MWARNHEGISNRTNVTCKGMFVEPKYINTDDIPTIDTHAKMLAEDTSRLLKIDELHALRLDRFVSLPQVRLIATMLASRG